MDCFGIGAKAFSFLLLIALFAGSPGRVRAGQNPEALRQSTDTRSSSASSAAEQDSSNAPVLPRVTVVGVAIPPDPSQVSLDREGIENLPAGDGSLNELLRVLPGIQTSENYRSSHTGGEILPPSISISGGKVYENNFLIDGLGNNSLLDPTFDTVSHVDNVPGHPQAFFLDPELLDGVRVHRSNIPARYGRFTGGVVDARTRAPAAGLGFKAAYHTTRSEWTWFHIDEAEEGEFKNSRSEENQPQFRKHDGRLTLDLPLSDNATLLVHYSLLHSRIPLDLLGDTEVETRTTENLFLKALVKPSAATEWSTDFLWAPYEGEYFLKDVRDSDFTIEGGGYFLTTRLNANLPAGLVETSAGYQKNFNSRRAPENYYLWRHSASADWGLLAGDKKFSKEGAYGDVDKEQETVSLEIHFTSAPLRTGALSHVLAAGVQYERAKGSFDRTETASRYTNASLNDQVVCAPDDAACIPGEQFMIYQTVYEADAADVSVTFTDLYLEDAMVLGRFSLRPGVRASRDDLLENTDFAPRLAAGFDLFGTGETVLTAGANRYYGKTLLTHALAEEKKPYTVWTRSATLDADGMPGPWIETPRTVIGATRMADLDTPYADEVTAGFSQVLLGGEMNFLFIDRQGRDELTIRTLGKDESGHVYTEWTNEGKSRHREYSLSWERPWRRHYLLLNATWQETETSHLDYHEKFEGDVLEDPVWFAGDLLERSELSAPDYNREWQANLVYRASLPYGFSFTNVTRYRSGYQALTNSGEDTILADGRKIDIYEEVDYPESWIFDWKLAWQSVVAGWGKLILSLDANNVFNRKVQTGVASTRYELGRQFWLGVEVRY